ncbi:uncharacterized protein [Apostichopus japonicus]|uniref:uncharacterized protein isoform X1 n=1 Tax=Stichopus japonicus TaxID=307972 RepID=UPI003AB42319
MAQIPTVYDPSKVNTNHESFPPPQAVQTSSPPAAQIQSNTQSESTTSNTFNYQTSHSTPLNFLKSGIGILSVFIVLHSFIALLVMACGNRVFGNYLVGALGFYLFVCVAGFLFSATVVFIGAMQIPEQNPTIPWAFMMVIGFGLMAFFELVASSLVAARAVLPRDGACAVLGFLIFQAYVACLVLSLPDAIKQIEVANQSSRTQRNDHPIESPPSYMEST